MKTYTHSVTFCQKFLTHLKCRIYTIKIKLFFWIRTYFSLPGETGSYTFGYLNAKFPPVGSYTIFTVFF